MDSNRGQESPGERKKHRSVTGMSLVFRVLVCLLVVSFVVVCVVFAFLPSAISSTSEIAKINGENIDTIKSEFKAVEETLLQPDHHHKSIPRPQYDVKFKTEPNKYVRPLEPKHRATTAMSAKFR